MLNKQTTLDLNGPILEFVQQPASNEICPAENSTFIGIATVTTLPVSTGTISYRWYAEGHGALSDGSFLGSTLAGTATTTLLVQNAQSPTTNGVRFYVGVQYTPSAYSQPVGSAVTVGSARSTGDAINEPLFSNRATLTVKPNIVITQEPSDATGTIDERVIFSVSASLTDGSTSGLSYRWRLNGVNLSDSATVSGSSTQTLSILQSTVGTSSISVIISHPTACNSPVLSRNATMTILGPRSIMNFEIIRPDERELISSTAGLYSRDLSQAPYTYWLPSSSRFTTETSLSWKESNIIRATDRINKVVFLNGSFYAVGNDTGSLSGVGNALIYRSFNGVDWIRQTIPDTGGPYGEIYDITYGNGRWVAIGLDFSLVSTNGSTWTPYSRFPIGSLVQIKYGNGLFVLLGGQLLYQSTDGINWSKVESVEDTIGTNKVFRGIVYNGKIWCLIYGEGDTLETFSVISPDNLVSWTDIGFASLSSGENGRLLSRPSFPMTSLSDGTILSNSNFGIIWKSTDGINWLVFLNSDDISGEFSPDSIGYNPASNELVIISYGAPFVNYIYSRDNGTTFEEYSDSFFRNVENLLNSPVAYGNGRWVASYYTRTSTNAVTSLIYSNGLETINNAVGSILSFYSVDKDLDITLELKAEKGLDNGSFRGGDGGTSIIRFIARKNEEYIIVGSSKGSFAGIVDSTGGGIFVYRKGTLIAACAAGGNAGIRGNGGAGGGVNVVGQNGFGSGAGLGGQLILQGTLPSTTGIWGSTSSVRLLAGDTKAVAPLGGRTISCPKGDYWIRKGISPCSDVGTSRFILGNGLVVSNTALIDRGFKQGYEILETSGSPIGNGGAGGQGATGGQGGQNGAGGGGGSGYSDGSVTIVSTEQGGNSATPYVEIRLTSID